VTASPTPLHLIVYDLGRPWKMAEEIVDEYMRIFRKCPLWEPMLDDLMVLNRLDGDSYDCVLSEWDGHGPTPKWLVSGYKAQLVKYVSKATVKP